MAIEKVLVKNEDGTLRYDYKADGPVVFTGYNISGPVELADGRIVDVTEPFIEVADETEALMVSDAIGRHFEKVGHPLFLNDPTVPDDGFSFTPAFPDAQEG